MKFRQIGFVVCCVVLMSWPARQLRRRRREFSAQFESDGAVDLDIETGSGNIEIRAGSSDQVQITGHIRANNNSGLAAAAVMLPKK